MTSTGLLLYHGSRPSGTNIGKAGPIYLTPSAETASHYSRVNSRGEVDAEISGGVYPVYADIGTPLDMRPLGMRVTLEDFNAFLEDSGVDYQFRSTHYWQNNENSIWLYFSRINQPYTDSFFAKVTEKYDSIIFLDDSSTYGDPSGLTYVVFDPARLKPALGTKRLQEASYKTQHPKEVDLEKVQNIFNFIFKKNYDVIVAADDDQDTFELGWWVTFENGKYVTHGPQRGEHAEIMFDFSVEDPVVGILHTHPGGQDAEFTDTDVEMNLAIVEDTGLPLLAGVIGSDPLGDTEGLVLSVEEYYPD